MSRRLPALTDQAVLRALIRSGFCLHHIVRQSGLTEEKLLDLL